MQGVMPTFLSPLSEKKNLKQVQHNLPFNNLLYCAIKLIT
jgi:hypothetical protein